MTRRLVVCAMIVIGLAAAGFAADVAGNWTASFETQVGQQSYTYTFVVTGGKITGTAKSNLGSATLENVVVNGDDISFVENLTYEGMMLQIPYKGKISGDEIKFTRAVVEGTNEDFVAKRAK